MKIMLPTPRITLARNRSAFENTDPSALEEELRREGSLSSSSIDVLTKFWRAERAKVASREPNYSRHF